MSGRRGNLGWMDANLLAGFVYRAAGGCERLGVSCPRILTSGGGWVSWVWYCVGCSWCGGFTPTLTLPLRGRGFGFWGKNLDQLHLVAFSRIFRGFSFGGGRLFGVKGGAFSIFAPLFLTFCAILRRFVGLFGVGLARGFTPTLTLPFRGRGFGVWGRR